MFFTDFSKFFIWDGSNIIETGRCGPWITVCLLALLRAFEISSNTVLTRPVGVFFAVLYNGFAPSLRRVDALRIFVCSVLVPLPICPTFRPWEYTVEPRTVYEDGANLPVER